MIVIFNVSVLHVMIRENERPTLKNLNALNDFDVLARQRVCPIYIIRNRVCHRPFSTNRDKTRGFNQTLSVRSEGKRTSFPLYLNLFSLSLSLSLKAFSFSLLPFLFLDVGVDVLV